MHIDIVSSVIQRGYACLIAILHDRTLSRHGDPACSAKCCYHRILHQPACSDVAAYAIAAAKNDLCLFRKPGGCRCLRRYCSDYRGRRNGIAEYFAWYPNQRQKVFLIFAGIDIHHAGCIGITEIIFAKASCQPLHDVLLHTQHLVNARIFLRAVILHPHQLCKLHDR